MLLVKLGAPPRLLLHAALVGEAAELLLEGLGDSGSAWRSTMPEIAAARSSGGGEPG